MKSIWSNIVTENTIPVSTKIPASTENAIPFETITKIPASTENTFSIQTMAAGNSENNANKKMTTSVYSSSAGYTKMKASSGYIIFCLLVKLFII